jgi:diguanylate cyclase (GGDEF)-like protein
LEQVKKTMSSPFSFLQHYSFSREVFDDCREEMTEHNIKSLMVVPLMTVILLVLLAVVQLLVEKHTAQFFGVMATAVPNALVFVYALRLLRKKKYTARHFYFGYAAYVLAALTGGIYAEVFCRQNQAATYFMVFMVCLQAVFHFKALYNLLFTSGMALVFSAAAVLLKSPDVWIIDVTEITIAALVGIAFGWYVSHMAINAIYTAGSLSKDRDRFREESVRDELTGLSNRREYQSVIRFYISASQHVNQTVCAIMLDVDFFKNYNDYYGHQKGDEVLKAIGGVLKQLISEEKVFAARVGGEEFIVLWTENRIAEAERVAIKLLNMIIALQIPHERSSVAPYITASLGLYVLRGGVMDSPEDLYREADYALYRAKECGRNCIILRDSADMSTRMVKLVSQEENLGRRDDPPFREQA